jgi:Na+-driven multidrug efflux pump
MENTIKKKNIWKKLFGAQNLTIGKPFKVILIFAIPLLLSNILSNSLSLINSLVLKSTVGGDSVTAINQTGSLSSLLFQFAFGCSSGFSIIASQKFGVEG